MFRNQEVKKTYWAIVQGAPPRKRGCSPTTCCATNNRTSPTCAPQAKAVPNKPCWTTICWLGATATAAGSAPAHRPPPPDTLPAGRHRLPRERRPEIRSRPLQPRRRHQPTCPPGVADASRIQGGTHRHRPRARGRTAVGHPGTDTVSHLLNAKTHHDYINAGSSLSGCCLHCPFMSAPNRAFPPFIGLPSSFARMP